MKKFPMDFKSMKASLLILVLSLFAYGGTLVAEKKAIPVSEEPFTVVRVIDGDTIVVSQNGNEDKVRLLGIDTPETVHPNKPVECFGKEASAYVTQRLDGSSVFLQTDSSQSTRDQYDRLLAYVFTDKGVLFNEELVATGYAYEYTYDAAYKYQQEFKAAERDAREEGRGLWAPGICEE